MFNNHIYRSSPWGISVLLSVIVTAYIIFVGPSDRDFLQMMKQIIPSIAITFAVCIFISGGDKLEINENGTLSQRLLWFIHKKIIISTITKISHTLVNLGYTRYVLHSISYTDNSKEKVLKLGSYSDKDIKAITEDIQKLNSQVIVVEGNIMDNK